MLRTIVILSIVLPFFAYAQTEAPKAQTEARPFVLVRGREISDNLLIGINHQGSGNDVPVKPNRWLAELGYHRTSINLGFHGAVTGSYGISALANIGKDKIFGFRTGAWVSYLLSAGLSMTYYTDFKQGNFKITPELGFGMGRFKIALGYNIPTFYNKDFSTLRYADVQVMMNYLLKVRTVRDEKEYSTAPHF